MQKKRQKVLVIDDDSDFVNYVQTTLEHHGYSVLTATDGPEGIRIARSERPPLIILDLMMVPEDGFTASDELRACPETQQAAILVISAIAEKLHKTFASPDVGTRLDVDGFLEKPVSTEMLTKTVEEMLALAETRARTTEDKT